MREIFKDLADFFTQLFTKEEAQIMAIGGYILGFLSAAMGGFDKQFVALCVLTAADVVTGIYAAWRAADPEENIWSVKLYKGLLKKITIYFAVALAVEVDAVTKTDFCRYAIIAGFGTMEAVSIIENADRGGWGYWIPPFLRNHLKELQKSRSLTATAAAKPATITATPAATGAIKKPEPAKDPKD